MEKILIRNITRLLRAKGTKWISVNDLKVETCHWLRNARGAYIYFFLENNNFSFIF